MQVKLKWFSAFSQFVKCKTLLFKENILWTSWMSEPEKTCVAFVTYQVYSFLWMACKTERSPGVLTEFYWENRKLKFKLADFILSVSKPNKMFAWTPAKQNCQASHYFKAIQFAVKTTTVNTSRFPKLILPYVQR